MIYNNILEANGNTPLLKLNKITKGLDCGEIYVKYEAMNIGGSIKSRTALKMIEDAEQRGLLNKDSTIVEATSGNQGIALAMVGAVKGYKVLIVMPDSVSEERRKLISQYGASIKLIHDNNDIGECIRNCQEAVDEMASNDPNVFVPGQFSNIVNVKAQRQTGEEIVKELGKVDAFCSGIGTGGTLTGIGSVLKENNPDCYIVAIEPDDAAILSGGIICSHMQMGIGDGVIPTILDKELYDEIMIVTDEEALAMSKRLAKEEGLICGISSGTNVAIALKLAKKLGKGKKIVTVLADTGERYYSTPLFED